MRLRVQEKIKEYTFIENPSLFLKKRFPSLKKSEKTKALYFITIHNKQILSQVQRKIEVLEETNTLLERLNILGEYQLTEANYLFLLCHFSYLTYLDLLIENNIALSLLISICHCNNPLNVIKRILICQQTGLSYQEEEGTLSSFVQTEEMFLCQDSDLDAYLSNSVSTLGFMQIKGKKVHNAVVEIKENLDKEYLYDANTYRMGNTLISRPKVLRNLSYLKENNLYEEKNLPFAFVSSSIYGEKDIYTITSHLTPKKL